jgi:hypothetical protein
MGEGHPQKAEEGAGGQKESGALWPRELREREQAVEWDSREKQLSHKRQCEEGSCQVSGLTMRRD